MAGHLRHMHMQSISMGQSRCLEDLDWSEEAVEGGRGLSRKGSAITLSTLASSCGSENHWGSERGVAC